MASYRFSFSERPHTEDWAIREHESLDAAATKHNVASIWPDIWNGTPQVSVSIVPCDAESPEGQAVVTRFGVDLF